MKIWCAGVEINKPELLHAQGPLLIAANHPNSFLDAICLATLFERPVYSLARGDVFKKPRMNSLLRSMKMLPVYRISEGAENLNDNYKTFDACLEIFKKNGIVLIFSEGHCENEWKLRPLKKGTARLVNNAWEDHIDLTIIPLGINYDNFGSFGKKVKLNFGEAIRKHDFENIETLNFGRRVQEFNKILFEKLKPLVIVAENENDPVLSKAFRSEKSSALKILLFIPACLGYILHAPLYLSIRYIIRKKLFGSGHYDSGIVASLFITYPLWVFILTAIVYALTQSTWALSMPLLMYVTAFAFVRYKKNRIS